MSLLANQSNSRPDTTNWALAGAGFGGGFGVKVDFNPTTITSAISYKLGTASFPYSLSKVAVIDGWVEIITSVSFTGRFYITTDSAGGTNGAITYVSAVNAGTRNYINLTGMSCVPSGSNVYLFVNASTPPASPANVTISGIEWGSVPYSVMPSNNTSTGYTGASPGSVTITGN